MSSRGRGEPVRNEIAGGIFFSAVIQGRDITVQLPPEIKPALAGLPSGTAAFTGRDTEVAALLESLRPCADGAGDGLSDASSAGPRVTAISGLAGAGKTELAIQAAHAAVAQGWFPGGVLFLDLQGYDPALAMSADQALDGFLRALGVPAEYIPPQEQDRTRLYASVLDAYAREGRQILVVVDNAATHAQVRPLLPEDGANSAIVTSRDTLGMLQAVQLSLAVLSPQAATAMLDKTLHTALPTDTRVRDHPADAAAVADLCGRLPQALRIVAALLAEDPARPLAAMAVDLRDERTRLDEFSYGEIGVRAAFDLSYGRLDPALARLFRLLPVNPGPELSTEAAAMLANVELVVARRGLESLARAHLVEHGTAYGRWKMHDLVRLFADERGQSTAAADGRDEAFDRLSRRYLDTCRNASAHLIPTSSSPASLGFSDRRTALDWLDVEYPNLFAAVHAADGRARGAMAIDLAQAMADYLDWRRLFSDWVTLANIARDAARADNCRYCEASVSDNLGIALMHLGRRREAVDALKTAVGIYRDLGNKRGERTALDNLASVLTEDGQHQEAITTAQAAMQLSRNAGDQHGESIALSVLGTALLRAGRPDDAITTWQAGLQLCREIGNRRGEGNALDNIGDALIRLGRFEDAITTLHAAVQAHRDYGDRHGEAIALDDLGHAAGHLLRYDDAVAFHRASLQVHRDIDDKEGEARASHNLGLALRHAGQFGEAITAHQEAVVGYSELGDVRGEGKALRFLGQTLRAAGRFPEAISALENAVRIFTKIGAQQYEALTQSEIEAVQRENTVGSAKSPPTTPTRSPGPSTL